MPTIAIILNGEGLREQQLRSVVDQAEIIIAADGGANYCVQHNIHPHYIIGDLDSIHVAHEKLLPDSEVIRVDDQYSTDLEKAMKLAETLHGDRWLILNATGKRTDHTLANILFLAQKSKEIDLQIIDNYGRLRFLWPGQHTLQLSAGLTVSFLALQAIRNLTLQGFQYPLSQQNFEPFFVGISNVVTQNPCTVSFDAGLLLMYEVDQRA